MRAKSSTAFLAMAMAMLFAAPQASGTPSPAAEMSSGAAAAAPAPAVKAAPVVPVLHDWIVQDVRNGRAMIETRFGSMFLVSSGGMLPGLGRVGEIKRQNGAWIVVTERGLISSNP